MPQANIKELIKKLEDRNDDNASKDFIKMYGDVIDVYFKYRNWVNMMNEKNGIYQHGETTKESFLRYIELLEDIEKNGQLVPITKSYDKFGFEIDGYHRLIILDKLGKKDICTN